MNANGVGTNTATTSARAERHLQRADDVLSWTWGDGAATAARTTPRDALTSLWANPARDGAACAHVALRQGFRSAGLHTKPGRRGATAIGPELRVRRAGSPGRRGVARNALWLCLRPQRQPDHAHHRAPATRTPSPPRATACCRCKARGRPAR